MAGVTGKLRRYLITGLIVVAPVGITAWVLVWLFGSLDSILGRWLPGIEGYRLPGLGLVALLVLLLFVGWMFQWAMGRKLVGWWNSLLSRLPLTRTLYNASSQIVQSVLDRKKRIFEKCVLIEYPCPGSYTLAFVTSRAASETEEAIGGESVNVFLPTSPNPTTGYLLVLPVERVRPLDMTVEEGIKMVLSAGVVLPGEEDRPLAGLDLDRLAGGEPGRGFRPRPGGTVGRGTGEDGPPEGEAP